MPAYTYILYSQQLERYYIGSTELDPEERLKLHLTKNYGSSKYTAKANDWEIYAWFKFENITIARKVENYIKRMRSRKFTESLKDHPEKWFWIEKRV